MDILIIEWEDSFNPSSGWQELKEFEPSRTICISVGILIYETDTTIFIAGSYAKETANTVEQVNGVMSIPKVCIIKRETIHHETANYSDAGKYSVLDNGNVYIK